MNENKKKIHKQCLSTHIYSKEPVEYFEIDMKRGTSAVARFAWKMLFLLQGHQCIIYYYHNVWYIFCALIRPYSIGSEIIMIFQKKNKYYASNE